MSGEDRDRAYHEMLERRLEDGLDSQNGLAELLREAQVIYGCISEGLQERIAADTGIKKAVISKIVKLYPSLKAVPYVHRIIVCQGGRCSAKGSFDIAGTIKKELETDKSGVSRDGRFLVTVQNCMKKCKTGPHITVDDTLYSFVRPEEIHDILEKHRR